MPLILYGAKGPLWVISAANVLAVDADLKVYDDDDGSCGLFCCRRAPCEKSKRYVVRVAIETKTEVLEQSFEAFSEDDSTVIMTSAIEIAQQIEASLAPSCVTHDSLPFGIAAEQAAEQAAELPTERPATAAQGAAAPPADSSDDETSDDDSSDGDSSVGSNQ